MVYKSAFLSSSNNLYSKLIVLPEVAYKTVTKTIIPKSHMFLLTSKAPEPDKINFHILKMI